jgi:L-asparaginase
MKHIALLHAGGTIGMQDTPQGYAAMPGFAGLLARLLQPHAGELPRWTLHAYPDPIDSSNATPADWQRIARDIAARYADYDGFVVLHGTDTMAYTAAALSFMLQGLRKPVILTGAQIPLSVARSDGLHNLVAALQMAASDELAEVAIQFGPHLLRGNRATKRSTTALDAFDSPNYPPLAEIGIDVQWNEAALLPRAVQEGFALPDYAPGRILALRCAPGMPTAMLDAMLDLAPQAIVLQAYGAGNLPDRDPALLDLLAQAQRNGVVLALCSQAPHGTVTPGAYAVGAGLADAGVVGTGDMGFEAIYAKLHHLFALGLAPQQVRAELPRNLCGEVSER